MRQQTDDLVTHSILHFLEKAQSFFLVFNQWIALSICTQVHTRTRVVHDFEVLNPIHVRGLQKHDACSIQECLTTELGDLLGDKLNRSNIASDNLFQFSFNVIDRT